jgi:N4-gp56 family major capsid protein
MPNTTYGDITPRTAAYVVKDLLKRAMPYMCIEKFGQQYPIPQNNTQTAKFRRYFLVGATGSAGAGVGGVNGAQQPFYVPLALTPLVEGVTPSGSRLTYQDYTVQLYQYGDFIGITDVIEDTHEDPILQESTQIMSEQAALTLETVRYNVLKAGTNVFYIGPTGTLVANRTLINGPMTIDNQRRITTALNRQNAKFITQALKSTPDYRTEPVEAAYIGLLHPDCETDIRLMAGFIPTKQYGTVTPYENEIGAVERVRYLTSTVFSPYPDAGAATSTMRSTTGANADVYPILYIARDAYGIVPLRGKDSITPMVVNPKPAAGDPLGQRGTVGWKAWQSAIILQDAYIIRAEVGATK